MTEPTSRRDRFPILLAAGVAVALVVLGFASLRGWRDLADQRGREAELEQRIEETEREIRDLKGRIQRLKGDPAAIESLAREELGWVRPDDLVVIFPEEEPAEPSAEVPADGAATPPR